MDSSTLNEIEQSEEIEGSVVLPTTSIRPPHPWSHDLVLCTIPSPPEPSISVEDRLANLLEEQDKSIRNAVNNAIQGLESRFKKLEDLLSRLAEQKE